MNEKEAIERIKDHMRVHKIGEPPHLHIAEALNMALDALEHKQLTKKAIENPQLIQRAFALACRILGDELFCPSALFNIVWVECEGETEQCGDRDVWKFWQKYINETVASERVCRVCGCTENNACVDANHCTCSWTVEDLCSSCAPETKGELHG